MNGSTEFRMVSISAAASWAQGEHESDWRNAAAVVIAAMIIESTFQDARVHSRLRLSLAASRLVLTPRDPWKHNLTPYSLLSTTSDPCLLVCPASDDLQGMSVARISGLDFLCEGLCSQIETSRIALIRLCSLLMPHMLYRVTEIESIS